MLGTADRYLEFMSEADLALLASAWRAGAVPSESAAARFRAEPALLEAALGADDVFAAVLGPAATGELLVHVSPFLVFAVVIERAACDLQAASFVEERVAPRLRVPVFDTARLQDFLAEPHRRAFLVEHLASYTKVSSGPVFYKRHGHWQRRRFSELDPYQLAGLLDVVPDAERPGVFRRLGDLALFLTGVFGDHMGSTVTAPFVFDRLWRSVEGSPRPELPDVDALTGPGGIGELLRRLGPVWYRMAARDTPLPPLARLFGDLAGRFDEARRVLTFATGRYLFPVARPLVPAADGVTRSAANVRGRARPPERGQSNAA